MESSTRKAFKSRNVYLDDRTIAQATVVVQDGRIESIIQSENNDDDGADVSVDEVIDVGDLVLMPGVVDSHVHVNEPGRTEWEGFISATRAAAAGGITTIVDMPLNSIPPTTSVGFLEEKIDSAAGKCFVDVAFWGGVVPGNHMELIPMIKRGVCGFKCFLIDSGVEEFPCVTDDDLRKALCELRAQNTVLLFHAELEAEPSQLNSKCDNSSSDITDINSNSAPFKYNTFLQSRPPSMETTAIQKVCRLSKEYGVRCHIVHLSASEALPVITKARSQGAPVTVETTHHYLSLDADTIPNCATQYKCCPPIRDKANQVALWDGVKRGDIDLVVSDHSPCTPDIKLLDEGDFLKAWGGIASVQFGLSLMWTNAVKHGMVISDLVRLLCENPAKLADLQHRKGAIKAGFDADFVIWDPKATFTVLSDNVHHRHKITPYTGQELLGKVHMTVVRGHVVYNKGTFSDKPLGKTLLKNNMA